MKNPTPLLQQLSAADLRPMESDLNPIIAQAATDELARREQEHLQIRGFQTEAEELEDRTEELEEDNDQLSREVRDLKEDLAKKDTTIEELREQLATPRE